MTNFTPMFAVLRMPQHTGSFVPAVPAIRSLHPFCSIICLRSSREFCSLLCLYYAIMRCTGSGTKDAAYRLRLSCVGTTGTIRGDSRETRQQTVKRHSDCIRLANRHLLAIIYSVTSEHANAG